MKKILIGLIVILSLGIVGCSGTNKTEEPQPQDSKFVKSLEKATKERWNYVEKVEKGSITVKDDLEYLKECVKKESDELYQYLDAEFTDVKLKKLATDYINGVKAQEESLKYYTSDFMKYENGWKEGYDIRSVSLLALVEEYGLKVDEKQFEELKTNSQIVEENKEIENAINAMVGGINFEQEKEEYGWKDYSAIVENTTDIKFDGFDLEISLLDKDGVVVENQYSNATNWKPGQNVKFTFSTDKEFEKIEWEYSYYLPQ